MNMRRSSDRSSDRQGVSLLLMHCKLRAVFLQSKGLTFIVAPLDFFFEKAINYTMIAPRVRCDARCAYCKDCETKMLWKSCCSDRVVLSGEDVSCAESCYTPISSKGVTNSVFQLIFTIRMNETCEICTSKLYQKLK